ncbi:MAG: glycosyltransferase family 4 protein [Thermocladium sp.]
MGLKVLMMLGYYEGGGFTTVVNNLSKYLTTLGVEVTVAAGVVRIEPPKYVNLIRLRPEDLPVEGRYYDVIHIHTSYPYTKVAIEHNIHNLVFTWHGYTSTIYVPGIKNKIINLGLKYAYKRLLPKIHYITSISNHANRQLNNIFSVSGKVIPNGVDLDLFKPCPRESRKRASDRYPIILNLTAYNNLKGRDVLIKSFKVIKRKYSKAILIAVGIGSGLNDVINLNPVPHSEVPKLYCNADFYSLTSKHESFSLPIIESFATGTPVIAYDRDDARREHILSSGGGLLFNNDESLLKAVDAVLSNWDTYSLKGIEYARKFDWRDIARRYLNIYEEVLTDKEAL